MSQRNHQPASDDSRLLEILIVEDSPDHSELIRRAFAKSAMPAATKFCTTVGEARGIVATSMPDLVLADLRLPDGQGRDLLEVAGEAVPVVLMTSFGDETQAVGAMKAGALDYVAKSEESFQELPAICWRASRDWRARIIGREAQRALAVSEASYRALFENVPAGIFQCDPAGKLTVVNPGLAAMLAYPDEKAMLGLSLFDHLIEAAVGLPGGAAGLGKLVKSKSTEVWLKRYDGGRSIAAMSIKPVRENNCLCCYEGFFFDLTQQRESDAVLEETRLRLEAAFKNTFGFMVLIDCNGLILNVSNSVIEATGHTLAEVAGKPMWEAPWWPDVDGEAKAIKAGIAAARKGEQTRDRSRFISADGRARVGDRSFSPVIDDSGEVRFIVVEGRDISDLVAAARRLEESELQFRGLFESASEALAVYDDEAGGFIDLNSNMETMFGCKKEQLLGKTYPELSPSVQPDGILSAKHFRRYMDLAIAGEVPVFEWVFQTLSGESITCEVRLNRVPDKKRMLIRGSVTDIQPRKEAEAKLLESRRRVSALVENATSAILEVDRDSRIISANPAAVGMLGHNDSSELLGCVYLNYIPRDERKNLKRVLDLTWRGHDSSLVYPVTGGARNRTVSGSFVAIRSSEGAIARVMVMCDDITERHANALNLEIERNFTAAVISSLPGVFFVFSEDGQLVRFNDKLLSAIGYSVEEAGGMTPLDFIASEDKLLVAEKIRELFARGEATMEATMEATLVTRDGRRNPYSFNGRMLEQNDKRFMVGFGLDISERRRNEARFRAQKKFADTVINSMPGIFYVVNSERRLVRWNENFMTMLGKQVEDMVSLNPMDIVAESDRETVAEGLRQVFEEGASRVEANFITETGEERPFLLTGVRLLTKDATYMVGMGFDISERRQYEAQLRASENYLRSVVDSEPECVWTLDKAGYLIDINPAGRMLLGDAVVEKARSASIVQFIRPDHRAAFLQLNESVFSGHSGILTFEIETEGGALRWLETHAVALRDDQGRIEGHLAVTRDITEKRNADRKIREYSERLQMLSQRLLDTQEVEKRHLARELHDEVGQSLTALKLNLEGGGRDEVRTRKELLDSLQIIDTVLEQVRDLSLNLRPAILDDLGLLPALRWYIDRQAKRGNMKARLSADSLTGVRLDSDIETAAFRIVQEALTNVLRHAEAKNVSVSLEIDGDRLSLEVLDDGQGFNADRQLRRAAHSGSFGLMGLMERALLLGGAAHIDSAPGKGAKVSAWLPLVSQDSDERMQTRTDSSLNYGAIPQ